MLLIQTEFASFADLIYKSVVVNCVLLLAANLYQLYIRLSLKTIIFEVVD